MPNFTKIAIKASFMKLLNEKPLNKISVKNIVEDCGINRNSFYYHFQDIPSLIVEIVTEEANRLIEQYPTINSLEECFTVAFQFALENKKAVLHIYQSVNRDIYEQYLMNICEYVITTYIDTVLKANPAERKISEQDRRILIRFLTYECFGACVEWMRSGMDDSLICDLHRLIELSRGIPEEIICRSLETGEKK